MREKKLVRLAARACVLIGAVVAIRPVSLDAACNSAPTAVDDSVEVFNEPVLIDVLANDTDADGQALTVTVVGGTCPLATAATVDFELVRYVPDGALSEECTIFYILTDEGGATATATIFVSADVPPDLIFYDGFESGDTSAWTPCDLDCP